MTAEIITIGDEILIGQIVNTNSVWIAQELNKIGVKVVRMQSIADDAKAIFNAFEQAAPGFVFITGGLGPTRDDITKKVFAQFLQTDLTLHAPTLDHVTSYFTKRGREMTEVNRQQALIPEGCTVIHNANGTAPGMWIKKNDRVFVSMPGVPFEMKGMMQQFILPKIKEEFKLPHIYHKTVLTQGIGESALAEIIEKWEDALAEKKISLAYLPQPGIVRLRLSAYGADDAVLHTNIDSAIEELKPLIGNYIYGYENYGEEAPSPQKIVSQLLRSRKKTLALAESCTGGYISSLFTALPGASEIFAGSVVPYSNISKHVLLGVDEALFTTVGSVSKECVEQLARNVREKFDSDYAISISGIAGPGGGTDEKPVGTVWVAVADRNRVIPMKFRFGDNRERNIEMTANAAINLLRKFILKEN